MKGLEIKIRLTFQEEVLGTASANPDIHREFIASKAPKPEDTDEEVLALDVAEEIEKSRTVFARDNKNRPCLWDYQIKGFFKDACGSLHRLSKTEVKDGKKHTVAWSDSANLRAFKKEIDTLIFVYPRQIPLILPKDGTIGECVRPLRGQTAKGERVSLATSETVPGGTILEFCVKLLNPDHEDLLHEWLDYGADRGLGQWRNSGKGRFVWEVM